MSWLHCLILQPEVNSLSIKHVRWEGMTRDTEMQERVIAAASIKVPASMRSGEIVHSTPCN